MRSQLWLHYVFRLYSRVLSVQGLPHDRKDVTVIIGVVAGGLAVVATIGLAVCCIKKKKKKEKPQTPMVGVYNANVDTQLPTKPGIFKKGRKKNESYVYAVIDDTMVYGHLMDSLNGPGNAEVGVYRPFTGPVSSKPPSPPPISSFRKMSKLSTTQESFIPMTDNETYTFNQRAMGPLEKNGDTHVSGNGDVGMSLLGKKELANLVE